MYNHVWQTGNVDGLDSVFAPDFVRHADKGTSADGLENLKKVITAFKAAYPVLNLFLPTSFMPKTNTQDTGHLPGQIRDLAKYLQLISLFHSGE